MRALRGISVSFESKQDVEVGEYTTVQSISITRGEPILWVVDNEDDNREIRRLFFFQDGQDTKLHDDEDINERITELCSYIGSFEVGPLLLHAYISDDEWEFKDE